jgi:RNA polymerase sigma factor (sigma-70 family)
MTTVAELFVITLARASRRTRRYLRDLERMDRDDVLATAILWCWENRSTYNPAVPLDDWFVGAIRDAKKKWMRGERREAVELITDIPAPNDTLARAEAHEAAAILVAGMDKRAKKIAVLTSFGYMGYEIAERLGISPQAVNQHLKRISRLRDLMPDNTEFRRTIRAGHPAYNSDNIGAPDAKLAEENRGLSWIDKEIERLDFPPPSGKECPPCWRCRWYDGFMPGTSKTVRMPITEPAVKQAVMETEARKIDIAQQVRDGLLHDHLGTNEARL